MSLFPVEPLGAVLPEEVSPSYFAPPPPLKGSQLPYYTDTKVPLKALHFYQSYISSTFSNGTPLSDTISFLEKEGTKAFKVIPPIEALHWKGKWYGMGNRRLACYHYAFRDQPDVLIPVKALFLLDDNTLLPQGNGVMVRLGNPVRLPGPNASNNPTKKYGLMWNIQHCESEKCESHAK
eukprot:PhF_6_TR41464/c1_g1_i1/m.62866